MKLRRLLALLLAILGAAGYTAVQPALAHADAGGRSSTAPNTATAYNTTDNSSLFAFAFAIRHVMGDVVNNENSAVAYASCKSCQTTAIAIEIVLVEGNPHTFTPTNVALAVNEKCSLCDTFASAYQFVVQGSGPMHFTGKGLREIYDIRREIASWGRRKLTNAEMQARLPVLMDRLAAILRTELVSDDQQGQHQGGQGDENHTGTDQGQTTSTPTDTSPTPTTQTGGQTVTGPASTAPADTTTTAPTTTAATTTTPTTTTTP
jgi:putative peptide zinc metalloprotease protein